MKTRLIFVYLIVLIGAFSCKDQTKQTGKEFNINNPASADNPDPSARKTSDLAEIEFKETEYNFGVVIQGERVAHDFVFTNTGGSNLVISNVKASCGCTVPRWSKEPIKPGESGNIEIVFDSAHRNGKQSKNITVYANTYPNTTDLTIRCDIIN